MTDSLAITPIGHIESPFKQKFAIPRQPGLAPAAKSLIVMQKDYSHPDLVRDIEQYSHLWLIFSFHQNLAQGWSALVRPPRLGGNKKTGVLATRSTFRPNGLGMSVVKLERVITKANAISLEVSGADLLDGTPIFDIKPYIPYSDSIDDATAGIAQHAPQQPMLVHFSEQALLLFKNHDIPTGFRELIEQVLAQDPRPAYKQNKRDDKEYAMQLHEFDIFWQVTDNTTQVTRITPILG